MTAPNGQPQGQPIDPTSLQPVDPESAREAMISQYQAKVQNNQALMDYYLSNARPNAVGIAVPQEMRKLLAYVGYPRLYVDSITERLKLEGFRLGGQDEADTDLQAWWDYNNLDVQSILGFSESLVMGSSYITIAAPNPQIDLNWDPTIPKIQVESANTLYAIVDPNTRQVAQAVRVVMGAEGTPQDGQIQYVTLYTPMQTIAWPYISGQAQAPITIPHNLGVVPVVPVPNLTLLSDVYGTSEITPELQSVTDAAARILMDMQGAAELMAVPQRLLFGVKPQDIGVDPATGQSQYDAYMARILAFADPEGKAFQFAAAELRNFGDALDQLDRKAAAYTGLPPQYLSFSSENPASAEAIESSEARLVMKCERKARVFGGAWEQAMRIAKAVMGGGMQSLTPDDYQMEAIWRDPATPTYASKAAAAAQLYGGGLGVIPKEQARVDMGYSVQQRLQMQDWDKRESAALQLAGLYAPGQPIKQPGTGSSESSSDKPTSAAKPTQTKTASPQT